LPDRQFEKLAVLERLGRWPTAFAQALRVPSISVRSLALETLKRRLDVASAHSGGEGPPEEILAIARTTSALLEKLKTS
jgi:hypothetical protein